MMDMTVREIDAFAKGHDLTQRSHMATALWAAWNGAVFVGHVWAGKKLPDIDARVKQIMRGGKSEGSGEVSNVIAKMREIARKANLPPPKARKTKDG